MIPVNEVANPQSSPSLCLMFGWAVGGDQGQPGFVTLPVLHCPGFGCPACAQHWPDAFKPGMDNDFYGEDVSAAQPLNVRASDLRSCV